MFVFNLFMVGIYQPLFNILILFYWVLSKISTNPDMGIAVILLTLLVRILLLPLSLAGDKSETDRREISKQIKLLEEKYGYHPDLFKQKRKEFLRQHENRKVIIGEMISLVIQVVIALSLWRIFAQGLVGKDLHLIYRWMPQVSYPYNLIFLGRFSLNEPHWQLNLLQSLLIFILETVALTTSPYPVSRKEVISMQLTLPLVSFLIFSMMPAGKKLFMIVTLGFSIVVTIFKFTRRKLLYFKTKKEEEEIVSDPEDSPSGVEKVVVATK